MHTADNASYQPLLFQHLDAQIKRSWVRSKQAGIEQDKEPEVARLSARSLKRQRDKHACDLMMNSFNLVPVFEHVIKGSGNRVMLSDNQGVILDAWGSDEFLPLANRVALQPGVKWSEADRGTNAIGTALAESAPSMVLGDSHYLQSIRNVSCVASPILDGLGQVIGVIDVSGDSRQFNMQNVNLAEMMAIRLESQLLLAKYKHCDGLKISSLPGREKSLQYGLLFFDHDLLVASNRVASTLLGLNLSTNRYSLEQLFPQQSLLKVSPGRELLLHSGGGDFIYACFSKGLTRLSKKIQPAKVKQDNRINRAHKLGLIAINKSISLLISGDTGVGKEYLVKQLHEDSNRHQGPLIAINCAALPDHLIEAELFGYVDGAFTGASSKGSKGKIRGADGGILFLDEIGELSEATQVKLLRVLQDKVVHPLGCNQAYCVDFSLVAASHKDLKEQVQSCFFREDLYFRLSGVEVNLPKLSEREDFDLLVAQKLEKYGSGKQLDPSLKKRLKQYSWPGNIRQLDNLIQVACAFSEEEKIIEFSHLPDNMQRELLSQSAAKTSKAVLTGELDKQVTDIMLETYQSFDGNVSRTAKALDISRNTLYRRLRAAGVIN